MAQLPTFRCADHNASWTRAVEDLVRGDVASALCDDGSANLVVYVAVDAAETVVGIVVASPNTADDVDVYDIHALAVVHDRRRERIATCLKQRILDDCAADGGRAVMSKVHRRNFPMLNLNDGLGAVADRDPDDGEYKLTVARVAD